MMQEPRLASISPLHYEEIPLFCIENAASICDIGCMSGLNAILSSRRDYFLAAERTNDYLGVDIQHYDKTFLSPIINESILDIDIGRQFDLVLALHVAEHIHIEDWPELFDIMRGLVAPGGYLIAAMPYDEEPGLYFDHVVHHIREDTLRQFIPDGVISRKKTKYLHFRDDDESLLWAIGRFIWRILTRHPYRYRFFGNHEVFVFWRRDI